MEILNWEARNSPHFASIIAMDQRYLDPSWTPDQWKEAWSKDLYLAGVFSSAEKQLAGFLLFYFPLSSDTAHLLKMALDKKFQRQGLATAALKDAEIFLTSKGAKQLFLEVESTNFSAISLYQRVGFSKIRLVPQFYGFGRDGITMQKECLKEAIGG